MFIKLKPGSFIYFYFSVFVPTVGHSETQQSEHICKNQHQIYTDAAGGITNQECNVLQVTNEIFNQTGT